jgi:small-conductance mechanosensitive channel
LLNGNPNIVSFWSAIGASVGITLGLIGVIWVLQHFVRLLRPLAFPFYLGSIAGGFLAFDRFGGTYPDLVSNALNWLLLFLACAIILRIFALFYFDLYLQANRGIHLPPLLPRVAVWAGYAIVALTTLKIWFAEIEMIGLLGASAVTSLVLGLALQPLLGNFFSGLVISLEKPFRINDWIKFGETEGRVVSITWRTTHLRTRDNDNLVIPNSRIADQEILNYFYPQPIHLERVYVGVHYRTPPYRVRQAILNAASRVEEILEKPSPAVYVHEFDESSITYELRAWISDIANRPRIENDIRTEIWEEFHRRKITIPFPIRTLEIEPRASRIKIDQSPSSAKGTEKTRSAGLFVERGRDAGTHLPLGKQAVTIGRSSECDLKIHERKASKQHCCIDVKDGSYVLTDLDSQFGTLVNDQVVSEQTLEDLDRIEIGGTTIVFENHD